MKHIKIFIAGAKKLEHERLSLKALTNDLNATYNEKSVSVSMSSYENFGERQSEYNSFIENKADIVLFIIDGYIGDKTKDELVLSINTVNSKGRPKVFTFVHSFEEETADLVAFEEFYNELPTENYYIEYKNTEDLRALAKERIEKFIKEQIDTPPIPKPKVFAKHLRLCFLTFILIAFGTILYSLLGSKQLLFVDISAHPSSITEKEIIEQINEYLPKIHEEANNKINNILKETAVESESENINEQLSNVSLNNIKVESSKGNNWGFIRNLFRKKDIKVNIDIAENDSLYRLKIELNNKGEIDTTTIRCRKELANSTHYYIKDIAAYIAKMYSPIASCLYDYTLNEGLAEYAYTHWENHLYSDEEREMILSNYIKSDHPDSTYCHLVLAHQFRNLGINLDNPDLRDSACCHYESFIREKQQYENGIRKLINFLMERETKKEIGDGKEETKSTLPEQLIKQGKIPSSTNCEQLIIVREQKVISENGIKYYKATLHSFEKHGKSWKETNTPYKVNLGINGISAIGAKKEGDRTTPSGFYSISRVFGYKKDIDTKMDFIVLNNSHIWICDPGDPRYNELVEDTQGIYTNKKGKNEVLKRHDHLNKYAIIIDYNTKPTLPGKGSAIFMHVERFKNHRTAGCISMPEEKIKALIKWLDPQKHPHIYISK